MRAALAQMAPLLGNLDGNLQLHRKMIQAAIRSGCDLVVFPELSLTGYLLQDLVPEIAVHPEKDPRVRELLKLSRRIAIAVGLVEESEDHRFYNTALFLAQGKLLHRHRKVYLPTYGMFDEAREFSPGEAFSAFSTPLGRFGILICEDAWHPSSAYLLARDGADYLLVVSSGPSRGVASGRELFSTSSWTDLCRVTARFQTVYVAYVNRVGVEDGMHFSGASFLADPFGEVTHRAEELKETLLLTTLSRAPLRRARTQFPLLRDERPDLVLKELGRITGWGRSLDLGRGETRREHPSGIALARGRLG